MAEMDPEVSKEFKRIMMEAFKEAQPDLGQAANMFFDRGIGRLQNIISKKTDGNPFIDSAINTTLNYSKQQLMTIMAQQIAKAQKYL